MRTMHLVAAAAVAFGTAAGLAAPAAAEPNSDPREEQVDDLFSEAVRNEGFRISAGEAIDIAHSTCDVLKRGGGVASALEHVKNATGWESQSDITTLGQLSVQAYCPTAMPSA